MKRIFAFVLFLLVFLCAASTIAEEIDISSLTLDELIELQGKVTSKIDEQLGASPDAVYMGEYVGGVDIKPGRYLVTVPDSFRMRLYADASMDDNGECLAYEILSAGDIYDLEIQDGMVLDVFGGFAMITPRTKPSWVP